MKIPLSRIIFLLLTFIFFITANLHAQWYNPDKVGKKAGEVYGNAYEAARTQQYEKALGLLSQALKMDPRFVDVYLSRAGIYAEMKNYLASVNDYRDAYKLDSIYSSTYDLPYSISLAGRGEFKFALDKVNNFLSSPKLNEQSKRAGAYRKAAYEFALDYERTRPPGSYTFSPHNLGNGINSNALEYFPSLTIDGSRMIFTRRVNNDEDFYESHFENGTWTKATPLQGKINTNFNEGAQNISQDGMWLIFTGCNYPEGVGSCDLYMAHKTKSGGWTEPENIGPIVNTDFWESSPSLSPDKKDLYFSSSMSGGFGGKDIWVTHRTDKGKWTRPKNLGPTVNTSGDEGCPFMHADNQTLYFNSNGHPGYGLTDLFFTRKDSSGKFALPVNLGYPINTIDDEGSLIVTADGKKAIYASEASPSYGGLDLFSFELPANVQALQTSWVRGQVFDKNTRQGLPSTVELTDINTRRMISRLQTDEDGNYLVTLPQGHDYAFNVNRKGYLFYSDNFSLSATLPDSAYVVDIPLQPLTAGANIVLHNIFFDNNQFNIKDVSQEELDRVVALLTENPNLVIEISGHTDNVGKPADNLLLSVNRAKAVVKYLVAKGISASRLKAKGFGENKPVAGNTSEAGKAQNRRTELSITSN
ncbi:MAG: OmpA family protein [Ferruginibacter sp.]